MKNLWRITCLFMLPGLVLGGCSITYFFHLSSICREPLQALAWGALAWSLAAAISMLAASLLRKPDRFYYTAVAVMSAAFTVGCGGIRLFSNSALSLPAAAILACAVSGAAWAWIIQAFVSSSYTWRDRMFFTAGVLFAGSIYIFYAGKLSRIVWLETGFYYLSFLMLLLWGFASPLNCRGSRKQRRFFRLFLLAAVIAAFFTVPEFFRKPFYASIAQSSAQWIKTRMTVQGNRFLWRSKNGNTAVFTEDARLILNSQQSSDVLDCIVPCLPAVTNNPSPDILAIVQHHTTLPESLQQITGKKHLSLLFMPEAWNFSWQKIRGKGMFAMGNKHLPDKQYDLLLLAALPENQYPGFLRKVLEQLAGKLKKNAVAAVPSHLLQHPTVFSFMHERFDFCGVLSSPGHWWIFSSGPLDLSATAIEERLGQIYGSNTPIPSGMYSSIVGSMQTAGAVSLPPVEDIRWGKNYWWGSWYWLLAMTGVCLLWRILRTTGERRSMMSKYFDCFEKGFAVSGIFLLALGLLLTEGGCFALFAAIAALCFAFSFLRIPAYNVWLMLASILLVPVVVYCGKSINIFIWLLLPVMIQSALSLVCIPEKYANTTLYMRKYYPAIALGILFSALVMLTVWSLNLPLGWIWGLFFIAILPGIWQNKHNGVY